MNKILARSRIACLIVCSMCPAALAEERKPDPVDVDALVAAVERAPASERPRRIHALSAAGAPALEATRKARDAASDPDLRRAYARAAVWQLAAKLTPPLKEGFESQLTFDGQYDDLAKEGPEALDALLALAEDAAGEPGVRLAAFRAIADVARRLEATTSKDSRRELLSRLRNLYHDPLLPSVLEEQAGFLLAIFGDTHAVDARIARLESTARMADPNEKLQSHLELAELYYRIRRYDQAVKSYDEIISAFERILEVLERNRIPREEMARHRRQHALQLYNAACSSSLAGQIEKTKDFLRKAVELDPMHYGNMEKDGDLANLRKDPGYAAFRRELGRKADKEEL
jgi:tetratricopeptide (TPR) repeat protein